MPQLSLSLYRMTLGVGETATITENGLSAILAHRGGFMVEGQNLETGEGRFAGHSASIVNDTGTPAEALVFVLTKGPAAEGALACETITVQFPCLFRLDELAFPPGAQAYRHTHPGPGLRHLRWGELHLEAADHAFDAMPGDTWFEAANSPVRATASTEKPETRFVRCMILPIEFSGTPSIQILDPEDAVRPKLQVTHRHLDQRLDDISQVDAG